MTTVYFTEPNYDNHHDRMRELSAFEAIRELMPWVVKFTFEDKICVEIQKYNLFGG